MGGYGGVCVCVSVCSVWANNIKVILLVFNFKGVPECWPGLVVGFNCVLWGSRVIPGSNGNLCRE